MEEDNPWVGKAKAVLSNANLHRATQELDHADRCRYTRPVYAPPPA